MRNGRPYAIKIAPATVIAFAALAVGYGLGEQAQLGERDVQTVTQEVRRTGERIDAMSCELIDPLSGGVK